MRPSSPILSYFGRSSVKIRTASGFVIYIDPYAPGDYAEAADLVLVSHGHGDHNAVHLTSRKDSCVIVAPEGSAKGYRSKDIKEGQTLEVGSVKVQAVPAANKNHPRGSGVGYVLFFDGLVLYFSGDSSYLAEFESLRELNIDWALVCCDGFYNMDPAEATKVAEAVAARHVLPIHSSPQELFDRTNAEGVKGPDSTVLSPGESVVLSP